MNKMLFVRSLPLFLLFIATLFPGCSGDYSPKPRGYFRIDFPDHAYQRFDSGFPYSFEYPLYGHIEPDTGLLAEPFWINLFYPRFNATLHISYKPVNGDMGRLLNDAHTMVNKHIPKASAITQREYIDSVFHVYGLEYVISGADAASVYQFYLTDSVSHFVRGALYFNQVPNNDSLSPVIAFLREDMQRLISSFRWKKLHQNH
jgi:gliding motility-associated lipoprotein GldD